MRKRSSRPALGCRTAIDLVEASYRLELDDNAWLDAIARAAAPELDRGAGVVAYTADPVTQRVRAMGATHATPGLFALVERLTKDAPAVVKTAVRDTLHGLYALGETFFHNPELRADWSTMVAPYPFADGIVFLVREVDQLVALWAPSTERETIGPVVRRMWGQVATHITAAGRLRSALARQREPEAIVDVNGRLQHASGKAKQRGAQHALRDAVLRIEQARGPIRRRDPAAALDLWTGLVQGRWSLVDYFDHDGRRFLAAHPNAPGVIDPRALRAREIEVLRLAQTGASPKEIAYALGFSVTNVRAVLSSALRKLGLRDRGDLLSYAATRGTVFDVPLPAAEKTTSLRVLEIPATVETHPLVSTLTPSEHEVARLAVAGYSNARIAATRRVSEHTVANQIAAVLRKLKLSSRFDLAQAIRPFAAK